MEQKARLGWRPDKPDYRDRRFAFSRALAAEMVAPTVLPKRATPQRKEVDRHGVMDQGMTGSCTGHGVGLIDAVERNVSKRSPYALYYGGRLAIGETDVDNGAYIRDVIKFANSDGAPRYALWPSVQENLFVTPDAKAAADAAKRKVFSYHRLTGANGGVEFKSCLAGGHLFAIGFTVYDNFMAPGSLVERFGIAQMPQGGEQGGHCVPVIGYDDDFPNSEWAQWARNAGFPVSQIPARVYECQNSWNTNWGRTGRFVIPAGFLEDDYLADDAWTLRGFADGR